MVPPNYPPPPLPVGNQVVADAPAVLSTNEAESNGKNLLEKTAILATASKGLPDKTWKYRPSSLNRCSRSDRTSRSPPIRSGTRKSNDLRDI